MKSTTLTFTILLSIGAAVNAHFDVRPYVSAGQIVTGGRDDSTGIEEPVVRAFGYDFGEDPADLFFAQDPGFNAPVGSGLPGGSQLSFNLLSGLSYWDGSGSVALVAPPTNESVQFSFGANTRSVNSASSAQPGFALQTVAADGSVHRHLNAFLNGADGNAVPAAADGVEAAAGIYVLAMELASSHAAIASSDPFYLVFNSGLEESQHDAAIDFVAATLVPEPATLLPVLALIRRRRNQ